MFRTLCTFLGLAVVFGSFATNTQAQKGSIQRQRNPHLGKINCSYSSTQFCTDPASHKNAEGKYVGHDEPALLFYSNTPGSGNSEVYLLTLPKDPPTLPSQDGSGGTWNFQLHPTFWAGMAMCDSQSYPEFTTVCEPDTDKNIFDDANPHGEHFIGHHPGTAFMEMQFYPPGWVGSSQLIDPVNYFAALNIDSFNVDGATGQLNNAACLDFVGEEPVNFAAITKNGVPILPPNPTGANFGNNNLDLNNVLEMAPGDQILLIIHDTSAGLEVILDDLTSGESGFMVASAANGFGQVLFQPSSDTCNVAPYDFHPMYSTSTEHTRVPWAAHSFNTAFSDEIGHFEFCDLATETGVFACTVPGVQDASSGLDGDDIFCEGPWDSFWPGPPFQSIGGCIFDELDFDGSSYGLNWPGTFANVSSDETLHAQPITFAGPLFFGPPGLKNYERVAFETDVPAFDPNCNAVTGAGCSLPAQGMAFYPIYTTEGSGDACSWQLGGALIPGTTNTFGGSSTTEYGPVLSLTVQGGLVGVPSPTVSLISNFHRGLKFNPCPTAATSVKGMVDSALR